MYFFSEAELKRFENDLLGYMREGDPSVGAYDVVSVNRDGTAGEERRLVVALADVHHLG